MLSIPKMDVHDAIPWCMFHTWVYMVQSHAASSVYGCIHMAQPHAVYSKNGCI
jgi:hypothetical protein